MHIEYNGKRYPVPTGCTAAQTFEALKAAMPELANAKLRKIHASDNYRAEVNLGRKG